VKLLLLGGTKFLGRHAVDAALAAGHEVTTFTRGRTNPGLFPEVEHLRGDRDGDLEALRGRAWDGAIDTSGYVPRIVRQSAELLRDAVERYVFVSSISAYGDFSAPIDEATPVAELDDPGTEDVAEHYGALKAACERVVEEIYGDRSARVRAGLIVGPYDPTDRFTYWVRRAARGGRIALPGRPEQPVQVVDSTDLATLVTALLTNDRPGVFNAVGPKDPTTMDGLIRACAEAAGSTAEVVTVPADAVPPGFALVLPHDGSWDVMFRRSARRAHEAGMASTPLVATAAATLAWDRERGEPKLAAEITPEREAELLG